MNIFRTQHLDKVDFYFDSPNQILQGFTPVSRGLIGKSLLDFHKDLGWLPNINFAVIVNISFFRSERCSTGRRVIRYKRSLHRTGNLMLNSAQ